jgi:hypothetical protein
VVWDRKRRKPNNRPASTPPVENETETVTTPSCSHHLETNAFHTASNAHQLPICSSPQPAQIQLEGLALESSCTPYAPLELPHTQMPTNPHHSAPVTTEQPVQTFSTRHQNRLDETTRKAARVGFCAIDVLEPIGVLSIIVVADDSEWLFWQLVAKASQHGGRGGQDTRVNHRLHLVAEVVKAVNAVLGASFDHAILDAGDLENFFWDAIFYVHDQITRRELRSPIE